MCPSLLSIPTVACIPACLQVAIKRLPIGREVGGEYIWLQHEMQQRLESIMHSVSSCRHICKVHGHCIKMHELYLVMAHHPTTLESVLDAFGKEGGCLSRLQAVYSSENTDSVIAADALAV